MGAFTCAGSEIGKTPDWVRIIPCYAVYNLFVVHYYMHELMHVTLRTLPFLAAFRVGLHCGLPDAVQLLVPGALLTKCKQTRIKNSLPLYVAACELIARSI